MSRYRIRIGEDRHSAVIATTGNRLRCEIDGEQVSGTLIQVTPPYYALQLDDGRLITATVTTQGPTTQIAAQGQAWRGTVSEIFGDAADTIDGAAATELRAPMPGRVVAVHARTGARVRKGDPIVVIEAMKMQNALTAPAEGTLQTLNVKPGDAVEAGQVLAVISA